LDFELILFNFSITATISRLTSYTVDFNNINLTTDKINESFKIMAFIYYYLSVPALDLCIIVAILENEFLFLCISALLATIGFIILFCVNYSFSSISREAHLLYKPLNSIFVRKSLNLQLKLKINAAIERLSGPVIGIYCYDLFPFTNYEFFLFVINCVSIFFLILNISK